MTNQVIKIKLINGMDIVGKLERSLTHEILPTDLPVVCLQDPMLIQTRITPEGVVSFYLMPYDPVVGINSKQLFALSAIASTNADPLPVDFEREYLTQVSGIMLVSPI